MMMFRSPVFRGIARVVAIALLLSGPSSLQHAGSDDYGCMPQAESTGGAALTGAPSQTPEHCPVCHWTRSLRSPFASAVHVGYAAAATAEVSLSRLLTHRAPALDRLPARAPPASF